LVKFDFVVLGGGIAGAVAAYTAASKARKEAKQLSVALVSNERVVYSRAALLSVIAGEIHSVKAITVYPPTRLQSLGVKFYPLHEFLSVNFKERTVRLKNLSNSSQLEMSFEKLLVATGSIPKMPSSRGLDLKGVYTVKWFKDILDLTRSIRPGMNALVVGAGFIGMATANALLKRGLKVTVIVRSRILSYVLEPMLSRLVQNKAEEMGIAVMSQSTLGEIGGQNRVQYAVVDNKKMDSDFVVFATGVRPNTGMFTEAGIEVADDHAVKTDSKMQTNIKDVYSVGDCAEKLDFVTGKPVYRPLGSIATRTARIAALNTLGEEVEYEGNIRHQYENVFNMHISSMGLSMREAVDLGVVAEMVPVKISAPAPYDWERLKLPFDVRMCAVVEKSSDRIVGWQAVGSQKLTSYYSVQIDDLIRKKKTVGSLQEMGLKVI
jgi:NADPH-dependent 2,4-dienoyl-CoA reductase/sulfur reductase-like enzyme